MALTVRSVLVTGSNRGIGLELIKQLACLPSPPQFIFAGCRSPDKAKELDILKDAYKNIEVLKIDVCDERTIYEAKEKVDHFVKDQGLNLLINNAGIIFWEKTIEDTTADNLRECFNVNLVGTAMVCKIFLPLIRKASKAFSHLPTSPARAAILNMGSQIASAGRLGTGMNNISTRNYSYRISKCGVNMLTKSLSLELKPDNILCVCLHPGWVRTDMGGPKGLISSEESVTGLINIISSFTEEHNGLLYRIDGSLIPW